MKIICQQKDLEKSLSLVKSAVADRPTHPVLGCILMTAKLDEATLTGFDLSIGIQSNFAAEVLLEGAIAIPSKLLGGVVSKLPNGELTIETTEEKGENPSVSISIKYKGGKSRLQCMYSDEFPEFTIISPEVTVEIPSGDLTKALSAVSFAASSDETKQILTGVNFAIIGDELNLAATDGHRLAIAAIAAIATSSSVKDYSLNFLAKHVKELEKILKQTDELTTKIEMASGHVSYNHGGVVFVSRTLEGDYPEYKKLVPSAFKRHIQCDRLALIKAIERVAILSDKNIVKIIMSNQSQEIELTSEAEIGSGSEILSTQISNSDLLEEDELAAIAFSAKYLLDGLKALTSTDVLIAMSGEKTPTIITPVDESKTTYLLMPVQIRT